MSNLQSNQARLDKALIRACEVGGVNVAYHDRKSTRRIAKKVRSVKRRFKQLHDQMVAQFGAEAIERRKHYSWPKRRNGSKRKW